MEDRRTTADMPGSTGSRGPGAGLSRRQFVKTAGVTAAGTLLPGLLDQRADARSDSGKPPNILFILVDEMRFPTVFPAGIHTPDQFLHRFMPNTFELWRRGVKFANHYTAGTACTPARGVLATGLYTQQSWLVMTILSKPGQPVAIQPVLNSAYPTYGKLLRQAGYRTPYIGKWHLSIPHAGPDRLEAYGFEGLTYPDPTGFNLQGTVGNTGLCSQDVSACFLSDQDVADQAASWLSSRNPGEGQWCLTVGFVNPHDKEFFPAGTEFQTFADLFAGQSLKQWTNYANAPVVAPTEQGPIPDPFPNPLENPPSYGYPAVPPNWESLAHLQAHKPAGQTVAHQFMAMVWGGVTDDTAQNDFSIVPYPQPANTWGIGTAPFSYWQRSLDCYTKIQTLLDERIGQVLRALPPAVAENTVIIFTSDHGEYAGAHGFVSGKTGSAYNEALRVPLIVVDPTGRFTGDIDIVRTQLTSSVDFLPLIVSLGHNGSTKWMRGDLNRLYRHRYNMLPLLRHAHPRGRPYVLFATDEASQPIYNFLNAPMHIVGLRTVDAKLAAYVDWKPGTTEIDLDGPMELEFYDYATPGGAAEIHNTPHDLRATRLLKDLLKDLIPHELQAPLPAALRGPQAEAHRHLIDYIKFLDRVSAEQWLAGAGQTILGYGFNVP